MSRFLNYLLDNPKVFSIILTNHKCASNDYHCGIIRELIRKEVKGVETYRNDTHHASIYPHDIQAARWLRDHSQTKYR